MNRRLILDTVLGDVPFLIALAAICFLLLVVWPAYVLARYYFRRWNSRRYIRHTLQSLAAERRHRAAQPDLIGDALLDRIRQEYEPLRGLRMVKK